MAEHRSSQSGWLSTVAAFALLLVTVGVAWGDHVSNQGQTVAENVSFLGTDVSGKSSDDVRDLVMTRAEEVLSTDVIIDVGDAELAFSAEEVGFSYDVDAVVTAVMEARHSGGLGQQVIDWLTSPWQPIARGDRVGYDPETALTRLGGEPDLVLTEPAEPKITMEGENHLYVVEGVEGGVVDVEDLVARLERENPTSGEIRLEAKRTRLPPTVSDAQAQAVADSLNEITEGGVEILVGSARASIGTRLLRRQLHAVPANGNITVSFDADRLHTLLEGLLSEPVTEMIPPELTVEDDRPVVVDPGEPPSTCCDPASTRRAADLIMAGGPGPIRVEPRPVDDSRWVAWASGAAVTEKVGEFTTRHSCCENRVRNIHLIADIVRGIYLLPGDSVSLNEYVGQRTREKGFVAAGAIRRGHLESEVGGGVSQFATTIFNAAFFAGLDIPVYQAHSLYFSRYPFGREATISYPAPDLVLQNSTDHPVLIWTSYTDTSITVSMYSTEHVEVEEIDQRSAKWNQCTHVETDRQRTFPDGRVVVDTFEALYRPADGIDCNGNVIPQS